jgi:hypothetical protein
MLAELQLLYGNPPSHVRLCVPLCRPSPGTVGRVFSALPTAVIPEQIEFFGEGLEYLHKHPEWNSQPRRQLED